MVIYLLTGYRRTGKDGLCSILKHGLGAGQPFPWEVRALGVDPVVSHLNATLKGCHPVQRIAFADTLKEEVHQQLQDQFPPGFDPEQEKDRAIFNGKTLRQHYIDHGAKRRAEDPDYWVHAAFRGREKLLANADIVVTDWRFPNEGAVVERIASQHQVPVITIRLFRHEVPIPPNDEPSEHSLDQHDTDLLLLGTNQPELQRTAAIQQFPQYRNYRSVKI